MRRIMLAVLLVSTPAAAQFKPTPYAATEEEAAKNECMKYALPKPAAHLRRPQMRTDRPESWEIGHEGCEQVWLKWKAQYDGGQAARDASKAAGEAANQNALKDAVNAR